MNLSDLAFTEAKVSVPGGELAVRGLSLSDIVSLVSSHKSALAGLFAQVTGDPDLALEDASELGAGLLRTAPDLAAEIIALGCGEPGAAEAAGRLPLSVQLAALEKIGELTFVTEGGPKKVLETVIRMAGGATALLRDLRT